MFTCVCQRLVLRYSTKKSEIMPCVKRQTDVAMKLALKIRDRYFIATKSRVGFDRFRSF